MKKLWERVFIILAIFIAGFAFLRPQAKAVTTAAPIVVLSSDQSVTNDYVAAGNSITLSGTVSSGDAYVAAGTVLIDGTVDGDLLVAGGNVTITGTVNGNVRAAGGNIVLSGRVGRNFSVAAGNVTVGKDATIGGNLVSFFGNLEDNGLVEGNMTLTGGHVSLGGTTQGNIDAKVAQLSFAKGALLAGDLTYTSQNEAKFSPEATISGKIAYTPLYIQMEKDQNVRPFTHALDVLRSMRPAFEFAGFITAFIIGFIFLKLFPRRMMRKNEILSGKLLKTIFVGILFLVLTPAVAAVLAITLIGIPLAMIAVLIYLAVIYLAKIWVGFCFGRWLLVRAGVGQRRGWALLAGLLFYYTVIMIPYVGVIVKIGVLLAGTGVLVMEKTELYKNLAKKRII